MDLINALGPISRLICLGVMCIWAPAIILLFVQQQWQVWIARNRDRKST